MVFNISNTNFNSLFFPSFTNLFDFLIQLLYNTDLTFFSLVVLLLISFMLTSLPNLVYQVVNLSFLSLVVIALWINLVGNNIVFMAYILAFVGAVVMLFLSVIMMLPSSVIAVQPQVNFVLFAPLFIVSYLLSFILPSFNSLILVSFWLWMLELIIFIVILIICVISMHKELKNKNALDAIHFLFKHFCAYWNLLNKFNFKTMGRFIMSAYNKALSSPSLETNLNDAAANQLLSTISHHVEFNYAHGLKIDITYKWLAYWDGFMLSLVYRVILFLGHTIKKLNPNSNDSTYIPLQMLEEINGKVSWFDKFFNMHEATVEEMSWNIMLPAYKYIKSNYNFIQILWYSSLVIWIHLYKYLIINLVLTFQLSYYSTNHFFETLSQAILMYWVLLSILNLAAFQTSHSKFSTNINTAFWNSYEGILGIKYVMYENNPVLIIVSVVVLLVALIGAAILSKKKPK